MRHVTPPAEVGAENERNGQNEVTGAEPELSVGDNVTLPKYGTGRVAAIENGSLVVRFTDGRQRKFKPEFVRPASRSRQKM